MLTNLFEPLLEPAQSDDDDDYINESQIREGRQVDAEREVRVFKDDGCSVGQREEVLGNHKLSGIVREETVGFDILAGTWANFIQGN